MPNLLTTIHIYTDGSCNPQHRIGGWAALLFIDNREYRLSGFELNATHNRMELLSVIKAVEYLESQNLAQHEIVIISDSQYVVGLLERKERLKNAHFITKNGSNIQNFDLVEAIIHYIETLNIRFEKVKAHQKKTDTRNPNREVDKTARQIVRNFKMADK